MYISLCSFNVTKNDLIEIHEAKLCINVFWSFVCISTENAVIKTCLLVGFIFWVFLAGETSM